MSLIGCGSSSSQRYHLKNDSAPINPPDLSKIEDAQPRYEPHSRQGNKPYEVFNKNYQVLPTAKDYAEVGKASYYGSKFHGYLTSNGEVYDMFSMSGAHKSLPLPSFVRVTNLDNNKQVIVRINDRGPFHAERIIDLSYAAAYKLDMLKQGVSNVKLEAIHIEAPTESSFLSASTQKHYIQIVASKDKKRLLLIGKELESKYNLSARVKSVKGLHKLQLGPMLHPLLAEKLLQTIRQQGYPQSYLLTD
ncbi:septal ring lytic transglycosylase RlpA family protein [Parashewanella spongiae]|uniref:Endolytic peptidoglycan transglycosylase RlpA n=2 Tax=Parashewanella spongiae TaxID=342950 RepID=A0A3A6TTT8_9GAMM|nr:septal ring lytic transglycosylase RlpA family protein [Parashewanella spongiae]